MGHFLGDFMVSLKRCADLNPSAHWVLQCYESLFVIFSSLNHSSLRLKDMMCVDCPVLFWWGILQASASHLRADVKCQAERFMWCRHTCAHISMPARAALRIASRWVGGCAAELKMRHVRPSPICTITSVSTRSSERDNLTP